MVVRRRFIEKYLNTDASLVLEHDPMRSAVADDEMQAFVHEGFWQCMDTFREYQLLNQLWEKGTAPWTEHWKRAQKKPEANKSQPPTAVGPAAPNGNTPRVGFAA